MESKGPTYEKMLKTLEDGMSANCNAHNSAAAQTFFVETYYLLKKLTADVQVMMDDVQGILASNEVQADFLRNMQSDVQYLMDEDKHHIKNATIRAGANK